MEIPTVVKQASTVVAAIGVIGGGAYGLDQRYVAASDFKAMNDLQEARQNGNKNRERDILEELTDLLADICELQPTFRYCDTGIPD